MIGKDFLDGVEIELPIALTENGQIVSMNKHEGNDKLV